MSPTNMIKQCRRLREKLTGSTTALYNLTEDHPQKYAKKRSDKLTRIMRHEHKSEQRYIKLLSLGPGEAGKSTLIKQIELIHGETLSLEEKMGRIKYIRQNIFDSMVAILVAMRDLLDIELANPDLASSAKCLLNHSQVENPELTSKDILHSGYLRSDDFFHHVQLLWEDEGVRQAYNRSNEYQLLDCAAYFFDRLAVVCQPSYVPTEQDVLRCRVMTTSITETKFSAPCKGNNVNFKVLDVGGQQGERRKWITLFDQVTAVLYVQDISCFDSTLREDSRTNRLLESLKVFYQVMTTKYLRSVSVLTFMNKMDILREKIERGADFAAAIERIKTEAALNACPDSPYNNADKNIYQQLFEILTLNPFSSFKPTDSDRRTLWEAFPAQEQDTQNSMSLGKKMRQLTKKNSSSSTHCDISDDVVKAASYIKMLLQKIRAKVDEKPFYPTNSSLSCFRSYVEYHYTCAVDQANIKKVVDGCKHIIIKSALDKMGLHG